MEQQKFLAIIHTYAQRLMDLGEGDGQPPEGKKGKRGKMGEVSGENKQGRRKRKSPALFIRLLYKISRYVFYGLLFYLVRTIITYLPLSPSGIGLGWNSVY